MKCRNMIKQVIEMWKPGRPKNKGKLFRRSKDNLEKLLLVLKTICPVVQNWKICQKTGKLNSRDNVWKYTEYMKMHIYSWNCHQIIGLALPPTPQKKVKIGQYSTNVIRKVSYSQFLLPGKFRVLRTLISSLISVVVKVIFVQLFFSTYRNLVISD